MHKIIINTILTVLFIIIVAGIVWFGIYLYQLASYTRIKAEFTELEPFSPNMPVYLKGFKIGKVTKIVPIGNFTSTKMHIELYPRNLKLPKNIKAQVRTFKDDFDYVEIVLPNLASAKYLKDGDTIQGQTESSWNSLLQRHMQDGSIDIVIDNVGEITKSVNKAVIQVDGLIQDLRETIKQNQPNIYLTTSNLSKMSNELNNTTLKLNNTVDQKKLDSAVSNLEQSSKNINDMTQNLNAATKNITDTMDNVNAITKNVEEITRGVNCTMKERFGLMRLFFGKGSRYCPKKGCDLEKCRQE